MRAVPFALAMVAFGAAGALAQTFSYPPPPDLSALATKAQVQQIATDFLGVYTLASPGLPDAAANANRRILVTDLGGGPGYLRATNGCWKRISTTTAQVQGVTVAATMTLDGLANSPIVQFVGTSYAGKAALTISNACSAPQITLVTPSGVFGAAGSLGVTVAGGTPLSVAGVGVSGTWGDYAIAPDGSSATKIRGGSL